MIDYSTPADVVRRVSEITGVPVADIAGDDAPTANDARMMVVWIARAAMLRKKWSWREIGLSINRPSEATRTIARASSGKRMRDTEWRRVAYQIAGEVIPRKPAPPTARTGTRMKLNREVQLPLRLGDRPKVAVPPLPPERPKPVSENSKQGGPIGDDFESWGFQNSNGQGYQNQHRRLIEQNQRFAAAMREAGYAMYRVGPNGERISVEAA